MKLLKNLSIYALLPVILAVSLMSIPIITEKKEIKTLTDKNLEIQLKLAKSEELNACIPGTVKGVNVVLCLEKTYDFYYQIMGGTPWTKGTPHFNLSHGTIIFNFVRNDTWACVSENQHKTIRAFKDDKELVVYIVPNSSGGCNYSINF